MADTKITGLSALTALATDDLLTLVDISDTSMAATGTNKKVTLASLLRYMPLYPNPQSDNYTAVPGDLVIMTTSGVSKTVTLPAAPSTGDRVGVRYKAQTAGDTVTIAPNGKDIEGIAAASVDLKLFVADDTYGLHDYVEIVYDGTEWWIDVDRRIPHSAYLRLGTDITTNTAGTWKKITFDTEVFDIGGIADNATNNRFEIRRDGVYTLHLSAGPVAGVSDQNYYMVRLWDGTTQYASAGGRQSIASSSVMGSAVGCTVRLAAGTYIEGWFIAQETDKGVRAYVAGALANIQSLLTIHEVR